MVIMETYLTSASICNLSIARIVWKHILSTFSLFNLQRQYSAGHVYLLSDDTVQFLSKSICYTEYMNISFYNCDYPAVFAN